MEKFWGLIGKISTIVVLIGTIISIVIYFKSTKPNIEFDGEVTNITLPANIIDTNYVNKFYEFYKDSFRVYIEKNYLQNIVNEKYYLWKFKIKNDEDIEIKNLKISLPWSGYYRIYDINKTIDSIFSDEINLPILKPEGSIEVWAWINNYQTAEYYYSDRIRLIDSNGSYKIKETYITKGILAWILNNPLTSFWITLLSYWVIVLFRSYCKSTKNIKKNDENNEKGKII